ncbi:hypothetical protein [Gordonia soli]|uniref:Uncharacterized protein n=1 Tax=Gordonia soli NBRC 108243 TaxID=1223545 RepID=M0QEJ4_9ACTN|nr:hypothetical protein [Gordonia soli]GAC67005.1 hypothetical protein GS4_05_02180 [Gordonia soli NBRC 108243]
MASRRLASIAGAIGIVAATAFGTAAPASAQVTIDRGQVGRVVLGTQADCRVAPNGLTARGGPFVVSAPPRTAAMNVRSRVVKIVNRKPVAIPGSTWSAWKRVTPASPATYSGGYVWTGNVRATLEVGHLVEFWGVRGGLRGAALAAYDRYLTTTSGAPDFGSLGPWLPSQRYCQIPRR